MVDKKEIIERLQREGFTIIKEYDDPPNEVFPDHHHPGDQLLVVLRGTISVTLNNKSAILKPGDEIFFPAGARHNAKIGPNGCLYIDGERPK